MCCEEVALEALVTLEQQLRLDANCALAVGALEALGKRSSRSFEGNQVANAIWRLSRCIRQSEGSVHFLEVVLSIVIVDPKRMNSGARENKKQLVRDGSVLIRSLISRRQLVGGDVDSRRWCLSLFIELRAEIFLRSMLVSRSMLVLKDKEKKQVQKTRRNGPFINQVLHAISRGGNCGDASQPPQP